MLSIRKMRKPIKTRVSSQWLSLQKAIVNTFHRKKRKEPHSHSELQPYITSIKPTNDRAFTKTQEKEMLSRKPISGLIGTISFHRSRPKRKPIYSCLVNSDSTNSVPRKSHQKSRRFVIASPKKAYLKARVDKITK